MADFVILFYSMQCMHILLLLIVLIYGAQLQTPVAALPTSLRTRLPVVAQLQKLHLQLLFNAGSSRQLFAAPTNSIDSSPASQAAAATSTATSKSTSTAPSESRKAAAVESKWKLGIPFTLLAALAVAISYADRSNLSTAVIPMSAQFGWDSTTSGAVLSAFYCGYALTQIAGGRLADRFGGELLLCVSLLMWSLLTGLTPAAAELQTSSISINELSLSLPPLLPLLLDRVLLGACEGLALPAIHSMLPQYVPPSSRATAASVVTAACYLGAAVSNLVSPVLMQQQQQQQQQMMSGWQRSFEVFAVVPVVLWLPLWLAFLFYARSFSNNGSKNYSSSEVEATDQKINKTIKAGSGVSSDTIQSTSSSIDSSSISDSNSISNDSSSSWSSDDEEEKELPLSFLLSQRAVWAIIAAQYGQSWGLIGLLSWLPRYYSDKFQLPLQELAPLAAAPYVAQLLVSLAAGAVADWLVARRGWRVLQVRRRLQAFGMLAPALCLAICAYGPLLINTLTPAGISSSDGGSGQVVLTAQAAAALIVTGSAASAVTSAAVSCNQFDLSTRSAGVIFGVGNTAGCVGGLLAVPIAGAVFDATGSWDAVLLLFALHYVAGALLWLRWASDQPLKLPPKQRKQ